jgi:hypothetical protein
MNYYSASVGYNVLPGEAFFGKDRAFKGALYSRRRRRQHRIRR